MQRTTRTRGAVLSSEVSWFRRPAGGPRGCAVGFVHPRPARASARASTAVSPSCVRPRPRPRGPLAPAAPLAGTLPAGSTPGCLRPEARWRDAPNRHRLACAGFVPISGYCNQVHPSGVVSEGRPAWRADPSGHRARPGVQDEGLLSTRAGMQRTRRTRRAVLPCEVPSLRVAASQPRRRAVGFVHKGPARALVRQTEALPATRLRARPRPGRALAPAASLRGFPEAGTGRRSRWPPPSR